MHCKLYKVTKILSKIDKVFQKTTMHHLVIKGVSMREHINYLQAWNKGNMFYLMHECL